MSEVPKTDRERGDHYKAEAKRHLERANRWEADALKMQNRKDFYKRNFMGWAVVAVCMTIAAVAIAIDSEFQTRCAAADPAPPLLAEQIEVSTPGVQQVSASAEETEYKPPTHLMACVNFTGCSGTIISVGKEIAQGVSAAHCFNQVGAEVVCYFPNGKTGRARIIAIDKEKDLALFIVYANLCSGTAQIPEEQPTSGSEIWEVVGYPGNQVRGPRYNLLESVPKDERVTNDSGLWRWKLKLANGKVEGGHSGCGVFAGGMLVGVVSHTGGDATLRCSPHPTLLEFVRRNARKDCGQWFCPSPNRPPGGGSSPPIAPPNDPRQEGGEVAPAPPSMPTPPKVDQSLESVKALISELPEKIVQKIIAAKPEELLAIREDVKALVAKSDNLMLPVLLQQFEQRVIAAMPKREEGESLDPNAFKQGVVTALLEATQNAHANQAVTLRQTIEPLQVLPSVVEKAASVGASGAVEKATPGLIKALLAKIGGGAAAAATTGGLASWLLPIGAATGPIGLGAAGLFWLGKKLFGRRKPPTDGGASANVSLTQVANQPKLDSNEFKGVLEKLIEGIQQKHQSGQSPAIPSAPQHNSSAGDCQYPPGTTVQYQGQGFPVVVQTPALPQQRVTERVFQPIEVNTHAEAYDQAKAWIVRSSSVNPGQAEAFLGILDSFIKQYLSGKGLKHGVSQ